MNILRPLSPHLPIYRPQRTPMFSIFQRFSGVFLAAMVLFYYLLYLKVGLICFTYKNFYQFFFYSSKLILISVKITIFILLFYYMYHRIVRKFLRTDFVLQLLSTGLGILVSLGVNSIFNLQGLPSFFCVPGEMAKCDDGEEGAASNSTLDIYRGQPPAREPEGGELMAAVQPFLRQEDGVENPADRERGAPQHPSPSSSSTSSESVHSSSMGQEEAFNQSGGVEAEAAAAPIPAFRAAHHAEEADLYARIGEKSNYR